MMPCYTANAVCQCVSSKPSNSARQHKHNPQRQLGQAKDKAKWQETTSCVASGACGNTTDWQPIKKGLQAKSQTIQRNLMANCMSWEMRRTYFLQPDLTRATSDSYPFKRRGRSYNVWQCQTNAREEKVQRGESILRRHSLLRTCSPNEESLATAQSATVEKGI